MRQKLTITWIGVVKSIDFGTKRYRNVKNVHFPVAFERVFKHSWLDIWFTCSTEMTVFGNQRSNVSNWIFFLFQHQLVQISILLTTLLWINAHNIVNNDQFLTLLTVSLHRTSVCHQEPWKSFWTHLHVYFCIFNIVWYRIRYLWQH